MLDNGSMVYSSPTGGATGAQDFADNRIRLAPSSSGVTETQLDDLFRLGRSYRNQAAV